METENDKTKVEASHSSPDLLAESERKICGIYCIVFSIEEDYPPIQTLR